jgi:hypothetical protein
MKLLILTPLFPPDTGAPAAYVKTLLTHLSGHEVTIVVYGYLPESAPCQEIITIDKRWSKVHLLLKSTWTLLKKGNQADQIIINNGPLTELPAFFASFFLKTPLTLCISDPLAIKASQRGFRQLIHWLCVNRMDNIVTLPTDENNYLEPEKLPFTTFDTAAKAGRQEWWKQHVARLTRV